MCVYHKKIHHHVINKSSFASNFHLSYFRNFFGISSHGNFWHVFFFTMHEQGINILSLLILVFTTTILTLLSLRTILRLRLSTKFFRKKRVNQSNGRKLLSVFSLLQLSHFLVQRLSRIARKERGI